MKRIIASILILTLTMCILPVSMYGASATLIINENEIIYLSLPSGWDMNENKRLINPDGNVGFVDTKIFDEPVTDIAGASLTFLKSKLLDNIMLIETIGTIHIYEADTTSGTSFVYTVMNEMCDYMFLMCAYQNKITYATFKSLAQSAVAEYVPKVVISDEPEPEIEPEPEPEIIEIIIEEDPVPKLGDPIDFILSTDIVAYIDGMPITSYNVAGQTVVIVEELVNYGFRVTWDGEARRLIATVGKRPATAPTYINPTSDLPIGTPVGGIYVTDIVTEINGREYESFSLNGQTAVSLESLGDRMIDTDINIYNPYKYSSGGFKTLYDNDTRSITLDCIRPDDMIGTFIGDLQIKEKTAVMKPVEYKLATGANEITAIEINGHMYADLQKYCELMNITASVRKNNTITIDITENNGKAIDLTNYSAKADKTDMLLPLDIIITNGKTTWRSNNSDIAYYYEGGAIMVDIDILMKIGGK